MEMMVAYSVRDGRFWQGQQGDMILIRASPFRRGEGPIRVVSQRMLGEKFGPNRQVLKPLEVDEDGLLLVRVPETLGAGLHAWRLCVGRRVSPVRTFRVRG